MKKGFFTLIAVLSVTTLSAQRHELLPFGDFEQWRARIIRESKIIGANERTIYAIAAGDTVRGTVPLTKNSSPWATSNVLAIVSGVVKTSNTVFPESRIKGTGVRMETSLVTCKVLGMLNISVLASGSIYLGITDEPIRSTSNPYGKIDMGIPFTQTPNAIVFDYKSTIDRSGKMTRATGVSVKEVPGNDPAEVFGLLQYRWEDAQGNVFARRIATLHELFSTSTPSWLNDHRTAFHYGKLNIGDNAYIPLSSTYYCRNSHGKMVPIQEVGWAAATEKPTHLILMFSSGSQGAYTGALGNKLCVDNVKLEYER